MYETLDYGSLLNNGQPMNFGFMPQQQPPQQNKPAGWSWFDGYGENGQKTTQGVGGMALGAAQGIFNAYMGLKQYGLAKDQFAESKRQFGLNYDAQARTTNAALADRQAARIASNSSGYQSVAEYMSKYGIPGG